MQQSYFLTKAAQAALADKTIKQMITEMNAGTLTLDDKRSYTNEIYERQTYFLNLFITKLKIDKPTEVEKLDYDFCLEKYKMRVESRFSDLFRYRSNLEKLRADVTAVTTIIDARKPGTIRDAKKKRTQLMKDVELYMLNIKGVINNLKRLGVDVNIEDYL